MIGERLKLRKGESSEFQKDYGTYEDSEDEK
jgi:hypothetical protein